MDPCSIKRAQLSPQAARNDRIKIIQKKTRKRDRGEGTVMIVGEEEICIHIPCILLVCLGMGALCFDLLVVDYMYGATP